MDNVVIQAGTCSVCGDVVGVCRGLKGRPFACRRHHPLVLRLGVLVSGPKCPGSLTDALDVHPVVANLARRDAIRHAEPVADAELDDGDAGAG